MYPYRKTLSENPNFYPFSISSNPCPAATDLRFPSRNQASNRPSPTPKPLRFAIFDDQIQNPLSKDKSKLGAFPTKDLFRISEIFLLWVPSSTPKHGGSPSLTCLSNSKIYGRIGWDTDHLDLALNGVNQMELHTDLGSLTTPLKQDGLPKAVERCGSGWWSSFGLSTQIYSLRHVWWNYWILRWWLFPWRGPGPLRRPSDVPSLHYGSSRMVPWELVKLISYNRQYSIMDESEQPFAGNEYEPQSFPIIESELQLDGNDAEQQIFAVSEFDQQSFPLDGEQNFNGVGHENEHIDDHGSKQGDEIVQEQTNEENESEHQLAENEAVENDSKQDFAENEHNETDEFAEDLHPEGEQGRTETAATDTEDKKWPGWPGENVFRMLVPAQKVGNIIGRKGEYIKKIVEETRARIKILDGPPGTAERAVMVSAKEEPDATLPPAIDGLLRVHKRIVDGLDGDSAQAAAAPGGKVSTKLLVPATQAGSLIGKQGATVKTIQETSSCIVRVLGAEDLPVFALQDDRVVEVVGEPAAVHKAIELIGSQLRKFLVDRTVIPLFEMQMQNPNTHMEHMPPPHQPSWGPPHGIPPNAGGVPGYGPGPHYMPPPRQHDNYYPPPEMPPPAERQPHHGISAYGREPAMGGQASANPQSAPTMITQVTQHMQIPLSYADAVIGASGSSISYIRRASGATVTIQETRGVPGEMTVEISGTASQVQAAQQLIQNCMAGAGAPAPAQTAASTEQGYSQNYSSYAAAAPTYGSPPSNTGYPSQQGAYGSVYGNNNYGY